MTNNDIMTILGFLGALVALVAPILKLNSNLVRLNANFENMLETDKTRDKRITKHGEEIDEQREKLHELSHVVANHETRIQSVERRGNA